MMPNGKQKPADISIVQAFRALARGEASAGQQQSVLAEILRLTDPMVVELVTFSEREAAFTAGVRWVGITLATLAGGQSPFVLRTMRDHDDRSGDTSSSAPG